MSEINNPWNWATCYVEMFFNDMPLSKASGSFWRYKDKSFLISNWHVFSGRNSETGILMDKDAIAPNLVKFTFYRKVQTYPDGSMEMQATFATLPLYKNNDFDTPLWLEHPNYGKNVDVACLDITGALPPEAVINFLPDLEGDADEAFYPSQDAFIIGYPLGLIDPNPIPIWKRGSIATEPTYEIKELPKVYLDTASRWGMSGSIVIGRFYLTNYKKKNGEMSNTLFAVKDQILGIYSGRLGAHEVKAQLGIVWKKEVIDTIVSNGRVPINYDFITSSAS